MAMSMSPPECVHSCVNGLCESKLYIEELNARERYFHSLDFCTLRINQILNCPFYNSSDGMCTYPERIKK